jgi:hypothetical protein
MRTRQVLAVTLALCALSTTTAHADHGVGLAPDPSVDQLYRLDTRQSTLGPNTQLQGFLVEEDQGAGVFLPYFSHFRPSHNANGDWWCYQSCSSGKSSYVYTTRDYGVLTVDKAFTIGHELIRYIGGFAVQKTDPPNKACKPDCSFVGPVVDRQTYVQGDPKIYSLSDPRCEPMIWSDSTDPYCFSGTNGPDYFHAPAFDAYYWLYGANGMSYVGWGEGNYSWEWDGIA